MDKSSIFATEVVMTDQRKTFGKMHSVLRRRVVFGYLNLKIVAVGCVPSCQGNAASVGDGAFDRKPCKILTRSVRAA